MTKRECGWRRRQPLRPRRARSLLLNRSGEERGRVNGLWRGMEPMVSTSDKVHGAKARKSSFGERLRLRMNKTPPHEPEARTLERRTSNAQRPTVQHRTRATDPSPRPSPHRPSRTGQWRRGESAPPFSAGSRVQCAKLTSGDSLPARGYSFV
jgi:hypothetical protein